MRVDRRPRDRLHPLDLPRGGDVELLQEVVRNYDRDDDGDEDGAGEADDEESAGHVEALVQQLPNVHGNRDVDDVDVLGEPVQDPAERCRVEEGHRGAYDSHEHVGVEELRRVQRPHHHEGRGDHDGEGLAPTG